MVTCPKCNTVNPTKSSFCLQCGTSLRASESPPNKGLRALIVIVVVIFGSGLFYLYQRLSPPAEPTKSVERVPRAEPSPLAERPARPAPNEASAPAPDDQKVVSTEAAQTPPRPAKMSFPVGQVVIKDLTGKVITQMPAAVVGGGWIALPTRVCLGGNEWTIRLDQEKNYKIVGGILNDQDALGLWRIQADQSVAGPEITAWAEDKSLTWQSLTADAPSETIALEGLEKQGLFMRGSLPKTLEEPGVLMHDNQVVGWTFGRFFEGGFLWTGDEGKDLRVEIGVDDFYRLTFADSREEEFTLALAMKDDYTAMQRLTAFVNGFRSEAKLAPADTPAHLRPEAVIEQMRSLMAQLMQDGFTPEVANLFDAQILVQAADAPLVMDVVQAQVEGYGFEEAIQLAQEVIDRIQPAPESIVPRLKEELLELYKRWVTSLIKNEDLPGARRAFEGASQDFPNDAEVHLLGVQLLLAENNWAAAEELLNMREYPSNLSENVDRLQARISELKGQAGMVVIHFAPGSHQIPVTAMLGKTTPQKFIVDTGASMVTIPSATAEALSLSVDEGNPVRRIFTAGGERFVPEVVLPSIAVNGWEVHDVRALVLDLPNQPAWGLLGLNFLSRFRMDLNTEKGVLLLEPR
ncbi:MAG: aspartyl protease family protein [Desulfobacterales bacterium]|nr:MAG: aspartyl protease family protein [Desulfobacterales bacterium]